TEVDRRLRGQIGGEEALPRIESLEQERLAGVGARAEAAAVQVDPRHPREQAPLPARQIELAGPSGRLGHDGTARVAARRVEQERAQRLCRRELEPGVARR